MCLGHPSFSCLNGARDRTHMLGLHSIHRPTLPATAVILRKWTVLVTFCVTVTTISEETREGNFLWGHSFRRGNHLQWGRGWGKAWYKPSSWQKKCMAETRKQSVTGTRARHTLQRSAHSEPFLPAGPHLLKALLWKESLVHHVKVSPVN